MSQRPPKPAPVSTAYATAGRKQVDRKQRVGGGAHLVRREGPVRRNRHHALEVLLEDAAPLLHVRLHLGAVQEPCVQHLLPLGRLTEPENGRNLNIILKS